MQYITSIPEDIINKVHFREKSIPTQKSASEPVLTHNNSAMWYESLWYEYLRMNIWFVDERFSTLTLTPVTDATVVSYILSTERFASVNIITPKANISQLYQLNWY